MAAWFGALRRAWTVERDEAAAQRRALWKVHPLAERIAQGWALRGLRVQDVEPAPGERMRWWMPVDRAMLDGFTGRQGEPVRLWIREPDEADAVQGTLSRVQQDRIAVLVDEEVPPPEEGVAWRLDLDFAPTTFERGFEALAWFEQQQQNPWQSLIEVLAGLRLPAPRNEALREEPDFFDEGLNPAQRRAVQVALAAAPLALIHGPPGTGKTRTVVELVRQAVTRGEQVCVSAPSNAAVDLLVERLLQAGVKVARVGDADRASPLAESAMLDTLVEAHPSAELANRWYREASMLRMQVAKQRKKGGARSVWIPMLQQARALIADADVQWSAATEAVLAQVQVVAGTPVALGDRRLWGWPASMLVMDEASQLLDPLLLCAQRRALRLVLAGDHLQLPPTVLSVERAAQRLQETLFEQQMQGADETWSTLLPIQFRMHPDIMAWPNVAMYDGKLIAAPQTADHTLDRLGLPADPLRPGQVVFVDTAGRGWSEVWQDGACSNPGQAARTALEVRRLLSRGVLPVQIGVITPYAGQRRLLRDALDGLSIRTSTVDGFQGQEAEVIVVDLVRSNEDGDLGFLRDLRRMNVALTRARRHLLVVGDGATLGCHPWYRGWMDEVTRQGGWVSAWSDEAEPLPPS
jgi:DNA polymerase III delta prime subunit